VSAAFDLGQRAAPSIESRTRGGRSFEHRDREAAFPLAGALNPLEDLWRSLKAVVAANRVYKSVDELAERAVDYLDGLSEDDVLRLSGLLSSKFNWLPT
jgi:hypothetical protein